MSTGPELTCKTCRGTGCTEKWSSDKHHLCQQCPVCRGSGKEPEVKK